MIQYPLSADELNYLASLLLREMHCSVFMGLGEAKSKGNLLNKLSSGLYHARAHSGCHIYIGVVAMDAQDDIKSTVPPTPSSEENLAPDGHEIMDTPLTRDEVEEAVKWLEKKEALKLWSLLKRW